MGAVRQSREVRRDQIAEAALEVISRRGVRNLSVDSVARRVGIVPSALYRHFRGKEEIVSAAIERMGERLLENVDRASARADGTEERLRGLLRLHVDTIRKGYAGPRIIFAEGVEGGAVSHRMEIYHVIRRYLDRVAEIIRRGQERDEVRRDLDAGAAAVHFLGLIQPAATLWFLSAGRADVSRCAEGSFDQFVLGIRPR